jgi:hypothetical protein
VLISTTLDASELKYAGMVLASLPGLQLQPRVHGAPTLGPRARKVLDWPKRCQLAHAFLWEYS